MNKPGFLVEAYKIGDQHTEFAIQKFQNKLFILITQFGKISWVNESFAKFTKFIRLSISRNLYTVRNQSVSTLMPDDPLASTDDTKIFDIQQKFGAPSIELEGAIRYILNSIDHPHEILISLGIRDVEGINKKILDEIKDVLKRNLQNFNQIKDQNKNST